MPTPHHIITIQLNIEAYSTLYATYIIYIFYIRVLLPCLFLFWGRFSTFFRQYSRMISHCHMLMILPVHYLVQTLVTTDLRYHCFSCALSPPSEEYCPRYLNDCLLCDSAVRQVPNAQLHYQNSYHLSLIPYQKVVQHSFFSKYTTLTL